MTAVLLSARTDIFKHHSHIHNNANGDVNNTKTSLPGSTSTRQETLAFAGGGRVVMSQAHARGRGATAKTKKAVFESDDGEFGARNGNGVKRGARVNGGITKRKAVDYDEDIGGFQFSRATTATSTSTASKRQRKSTEPASSDGSTSEETTSRRPSLRKTGGGRSSANIAEELSKISVQTPNGRPAEKATRQKSKRLADDAPSLPAEKQSKSRKKLHESEPATINVAKKKKPGKKKEQDAEPSQRPRAQRQGQNLGDEEVEDDAAATATPVDSGVAKIALPFADTPVMQRNKEMRKEKSKKGQRRSSLTLRGRRASSLIETGASNALPHDKVDTADFYKHIASEGLPEPRRMKQLLTWCATRALGEKPSGSRSEDESARLAARVIQEELLKDIGNKSELSNWFSREETTPPALVVKKPNPKNEQNAEKIKELEEHIQRLQTERQSLAALLRPPSIPSIKTSPTEKQIPSSTSSAADTTKSSSRSDFDPINTSLLDPSQQALLKSISQDQPTPLPNTSSSPPPKPDDLESDSNTTSITAISSRLSRLSTSLAPTLDSFASGIHNVELFRHSADDLASKILGVCAHRLEERDLGLSTPTDLADDEMKEKEEEDERGKMDEDGNEDGEGAGTGEKMKKRTRLRREREDLSVVLGALSRLERR